MGATEPDYNLNVEDSGYRFRVLVTAENESGRASSASVLTVPIAEPSTELETSESEDSTKLVYAAGQSLYSANRDGSEPKPLADCVQLDTAEEPQGCSFRHPSISPSGEMIAAELNVGANPGTCEGRELCSTSPTDLNRIVVMNYDGTEARLLPAHGSEPSWGPRGGVLTMAEIVKNHKSSGSPFVDDVESSQLVTVNLAEPDTAPHALSLGNGYFSEPTYSPDDSQLAYKLRNVSGKASLGVSEAEGGEAKTLALPVDDPSQPAFSEDGNALIFAATPHALSAPGITEPAIFEINVDGSSFRRISPESPTEEFKEQPIPLPGGKMLVYRGGEQIILFGDGFRVDRQGGGWEEVSIGGGSPPEPLPHLPAASIATNLTAGHLGPKTRIRLIPGAAPDGWCKGHLHGIGEAINYKPVKNGVYETSGEERLEHFYSAGIEIEKNYDCEGGTSHIYWVPFADTSHLGGTTILLQPSAQRYDATDGAGRNEEVKPHSDIPDGGVPPSSDVLIHSALKFTVQAAKPATRDPRIWRFLLGVTPDNSGNAVQLSIEAVEAFVSGFHSLSEFKGFATRQRYSRWLPPACYRASTARAHAAACH